MARPLPLPPATYFESTKVVNELCNHDVCIIFSLSCYITRRKVKGKVRLMYAVVHWWFVASVEGLDTPWGQADRWRCPGAKHKWTFLTMEYLMFSGWCELALCSSELLRFVVFSLRTNTAAIFRFLIGMQLEVHVGNDPVTHSLKCSLITN